MVARASRQEASWARDVRLLLIVDEPALALAVSQSLIKRVAAVDVRLEIELVSTCEEAASISSFDLTLIDSDVRAGGAVELLKRLRASKRHRRTPALVMGAYDITSISTICYSLDAPVLAKEPLSLLLDCVVKLVATIGAKPRTFDERLRAYARSVAMPEEANLTDALLDVFVRRLRGQSLGEIALERGTTLLTVQGQSKDLNAALRRIGIGGTGDPIAAALRELGAEDELPDHLAPTQARVRRGAAGG